MDFDLDTFADRILKGAAISGLSGYLFKTVQMYDEVVVNSDLPVMGVGPTKAVATSLAILAWLLFWRALVSKHRADDAAFRWFPLLRVIQFLVSAGVTVLAVLTFYYVSVAAMAGA